MKHFFQLQSKMDEADRILLMQRAKAELKERPLSIDDMETKVELVCFNASNINEYVPPGLEQHIIPRIFALDKQIDSKTKLELIKGLKGTEDRVMGYVFSNISVKEIKNYLTLPFMLERDFEFPPLFISHFSDDDLIGYISDYLKIDDGKKRFVEFWEDNKNKAWHTVKETKDMSGIERGKRPPGILDRAFFSDIQLVTRQQGIEKILELPIGKLRTALGYFNKRRDSSGLMVRAQASLFLTWKDIKGFKVSSAQAKQLLGLSIGGQFIATQHFIKENVGGRLLKPEEVDFFRLRVGGKPVDLTPGEITEIEINIDTQQVFFTRGVGPEEFHIDRVQRLRLIEDDRSVMIDKVVPFNRGESNFDKAEQFLAHKYTETEKARQIRRSGTELELLRERKVVAGDVTAQLVLNGLNTLGVLPLAAPCVGFAPLDLKNPSKLKDDFAGLHQKLMELFGRILDLSDSPNFTAHDFERLTKGLRSYLGLKDPKDASPEVLKETLKDLGDLTQYMDDFFKLNLHNSFEGDLQVDQEMGSVEMENSDDLALDAEEYRLDEDSRDFISENFHFFKKRELVQRALLLTERMLFYVQNIEPIAADDSYHPDLVVFTKRKDLVTHYQNTAYPAICLNGVLNTEIFLAENEDEEMLFIQFMRGFTDKVIAKAKELNQTFHHQYKHTLAELTYLADEQKHHLTEELEFLENPANKEKAYVVLLEKITKIFHAQLDQRKDNIAALQVEHDEIEGLMANGHQRLEELLDRKLDPEGLNLFLDQMTEELEALRKLLLEEHKGKKAQVINIYNPFTRAYGVTFNYYEKVLGYAGLFQKALWVRRRQKMFEEVKQFARALGDLPAEKIELQIKKLKALAAKADPSIKESGKEQVLELSKQLKTRLMQLRNISIKGMFQNPDKEKGNLLEFFQYYQQEAERLIELAQQMVKLSGELAESENALFKSQNDWIEARVQADFVTYRLKAAMMLFADPMSMDKIEQQLSPNEEVPREIRKELGDLRAKMTEAQNAFKESIAPGRRLAVLNFVELIEGATKREEVNEIAKDMVNWRQGLGAIAHEIAGEQKEWEFLQSQEGNLEKVAMSKALPSTRILLKTQYIPLVEREMRMLARADHFLGEVVSKEKALKQALVDAYFRKRHAFPQFVRGAYAIDTTRTAKSHSEKNIAAAYHLLHDKYPVGCVPTLAVEASTYLKKIEVQGLEHLESRMGRIWKGDIDERCLYLPGTYSFEEALKLCEAKERLVQAEPRAKRSRNSLVLVWVGRLPVDKIKADEELKASYHQAILSNVFIDVDGVEIFDNRESIFEACIDSTFGATSEQISKQVVFTFFKG
ncbi:MAG: hypothetical protein RRB13_14950 [bacterium]|nr:hypothetical protein [bacterium]